MSRIKSVDIFRLIAILGVISIHSTPFSADLPKDGELYKYLKLLINQTARFAVPFFFAISGYFWGLKAKSTGTPLVLANIMAKKISIVFLAWCFIYLFPFNLNSINQYGLLGPIKIAYWNFLRFIQNPIELLLQGTAAHLWYLPSLIFSTYLSAFFVEKHLTKSLFAFSALLYLFGLSANAYTYTPLGIEISLNTRNGPFLGLLPFVSGYIMSGFKFSPRWLKYGFFIFLFGFILHFTEIFFLWKKFGTNPLQDYVLGTYFMGIGIAICSLSNHEFFQNSSLGFIGKMTLGIYAIHLIFIELLLPIDKITDSPFWEIGYVLLVFGLSVISVLLISRSRILKRIVL